MADSKHRTKATRKIILPTILLILSSSSAQAFASSISVTSSMTSSLNASADNSHSEGDDNNNNNNSVPQLPASSGDKDIPTLKLGESMKFEHLGPVIINVSLLFNTCIVELYIITLKRSTGFVSYSN